MMSRANATKNSNCGGLVMHKITRCAVVMALVVLTWTIHAVAVGNGQTDQKDALYRITEVPALIPGLLMLAIFPVLSSLFKSSKISFPTVISLGEAFSGEWLFLCVNDFLAVIGIRLPQGLRPLPILL